MKGGVVLSKLKIIFVCWGELKNVDDIIFK